MDASELLDMAQGYLTCALFTNTEEGQEPGSGEFNLAPYMRRVPKATLSKALEVCTRFYTANAADLADYPAENAGHDLWYTRNGHGCGFWEAYHCDRTTGERLTAAAHRLGECSIVLVRGYWHFE